MYSTVKTIENTSEHEHLYVIWTPNKRVGFENPSSRTSYHEGRENKHLHMTKFEQHLLYLNEERT